MESESKAAFESDPSEERFPLLLLLLEDGAKRKNTDYGEESSRLRSVARGAATVMSRWPCHLLSAVLIALAVATASLVTLVLMTILTSFITNRTEDHTYWRPVFHPPLSIQSLGESCRELIIDKNHSSVHLSSLTPKAPNFFQITSNITSNPVKNDSTAVSNSSLHEKKFRKIFFVYFESDLFTIHQMCSIESAAKLNSNVTCYVIIIRDTEQRDTNITNTKLNELTQAYANIQLVNVYGDAYFSSTPLYEFWKTPNKDQSLKKFAARVITIWQYGGTAYDLDVITRNETAWNSLATDGDTIMLEVKQGLIMSTKVQCHAFLYDVMNILSKMACNVQNTTEFTIKNVIVETLVHFCNNGTVVVQNDSLSVNYKCRGVKEVPPISNNISENNTSLWTTGKLPLNSTLFENSCPTSLKFILS